MEISKKDFFIKTGRRKAFYKNEDQEDFPFYH